MITTGVSRNARQSKKESENILAGKRFMAGAKERHDSRVTFRSGHSMLCKVRLQKHDDLPNCRGSGCVTWCHASPFPFKRRGDPWGCILSTGKTARGIQGHYVQVTFVAPKWCQ